jgi:hypothetical protein
VGKKRKKHKDTYGLKVKDDQVGFIPGMQEWFKMPKLVKVIYPIGRIKGKKTHIMISVNAKKN